MEASFKFIIEWFDELAAINKQFILIYFPDDLSVQIMNTKANSKFGSIFLKRVQYPDLSLNDIYIGNKFEIFSRVYT